MEKRGEGGEEEREERVEGERGEGKGRGKDIAKVHGKKLNSLCGGQM